MKRFILFFVLLLTAIISQADEIRPAYLEVKEFKTAYYDLLLKLPIKGRKKTPIELVLPEKCLAITPISKHLVPGAYIQRWSIKCEEGLVNKLLSFKGLKRSSTDVLLRLEFLSGISQSILLTPSKTRYTVPKEESSLQIVQTYTGLGIGHILLGFDHLLFVFALLLIVKNMRRLLWTITAFTLAHSITMISATLGLITVPQKPVEAIIALSIVFLAMEIMHEKQGKVGLTSRYPWLIAFIFGLLHGFGFAGALAEIGLPQQAISLALIFFNIGVEIGQMIFVVFVVVMTVFLHKLHLNVLVEKVKALIIYGIGGLSSFWLVERISSF